VPFEFVLFTFVLLTVIVLFGLVGGAGIVEFVVVVVVVVFAVLFAWQLSAVR